MWLNCPLVVCKANCHKFISEALPDTNHTTSVNDGWNSFTPHLNLKENFPGKPIFKNLTSQRYNPILRIWNKEIEKEKMPNARTWCHWRNRRIPSWVFDELLTKYAYLNSFKSIHFHEILDHSRVNYSYGSEG